ncbi:hypothetical protein PCC7424_5476 (plasmid) [Gloeothece citriformis PCC 7424]|uniref:Uncharacterized protein n=1 Tax=Gloeothece citriformis (strain PCC 7424) TaxID=65393 RepID=B7KMM5_GLOC7|nr:hypothetical protein [Gloeothece citriformis]ACK74047.1 hypothetical protein PCC7424_5476 [Gloeothece citriformis PCC 7424]
MQDFPSRVKIYKILYIDDDTERATRVQMFFARLSKREPRFQFIPVSSYKFALQILAVCHLDELAQNEGFKPFDFILFDINIKNLKYDLSSFLEHIFALGVFRLNLPFGISSLIALGNPDSKIKDFLLESQVGVIQSQGIKQLQKALIKQVQIPSLQQEQLNQLKREPNYYRVLYIDADPLRASKMQLFFNDVTAQASARFVLIQVSNYDSAIELLSYSNLEESSSKEDWKPFDFVVFHLIADPENTAQWQDFIKSLFELGIPRFNFRFGIGSLLALGLGNLSEATKDFLLAFQISLLYKEPLTGQILREKLIRQITKFQGSSVFYVDRDKVEESSQSRVIKRVLRLYKSLPGILLSYEQTTFDQKGQIKQIKPIFKRNADFFSLLLESSLENSLHDSQINQNRSV